MEIVRTYQHHDNQLAVVLAVSCDTDFCGRSEEFLAFVDSVAMAIASFNSADFWEIEEVHLLEHPVDGRYIVEHVIEARRTFKEDIKLKYFKVVKAEQRGAASRPLDLTRLDGAS